MIVNLVSEKIHAIIDEDDADDEDEGDSGVAAVSPAHTHTRCETTSQAERLPMQLLVCEYTMWICG